jgi:Acetoacetate decarboxylase (ADC)
MTTTAPYAVTAAAGLPETALPAELLAMLPGSAAGAPWQTRCEVLTWLHTLDDAALDALPRPIRGAGIALVAWALVRYADTPVGPYSEIAATLIPADGTEYGHIPFIVVDSLPSIVGGRVNWLLPKALARFAWGEDGLSVAVTSDQPATPAWSIEISHSLSGEPTPLSMTNHVQQVSTDGVVRRFDGEVSGSMRAATIEVTGHANGPLALLLRPGTYDGSMMSDCQFDVGPLND